MRADDIARARSAAALGVPVPAPLVVALLDHIAALEGAAVRLRAEAEAAGSVRAQTRIAAWLESLETESSEWPERWLSERVRAGDWLHHDDDRHLADERPCCPRAPGAEHKMSCPRRKGGRLTLPVVVGGGGRELRDDAHDLADDGEHWPNCACARCCLEAREGEGVRDDG